MWCRSHDPGHDDDAAHRRPAAHRQVLTLVAHADHELGGSAQDVIPMPADIDQVLRVFAARQTGRPA